MCFPPAVLAVAQLAVAAASSAASFSAQQAKASAERKVYDQNVANSLAAARDDQNKLTQRSMQESAAFQQKDHAQLVQQAQKQADVIVSSGGGNVSGISVGNLLGDVSRSVDNNRLNLETNWMNTAAQLQGEQDATVTKAKSRIGSIAEPTDPSPIGSILGVAGAGISAFSKLDLVSTGSSSSGSDSITTTPTDFGFGRTP